MLSLSLPGQLGVDRLLLPVLWAVRLRHGRDARRVCDRGVHGPLAGAHVAESGVLPRGVAVVGVGGTLVLGVLVLRAADGGVGGAVVLQVEGAVGDVLRGTLPLAVVAGTQLLGLDLRPLLALALLAAAGHRAQRVLRLLLLLLGHPAVGRGPSGPVAAAGVRLGAVGHRDPWVPVRRQVLVELVDVKRLHVGDDITAQLANIYSPKVDALLQRAAFALQVCFAGWQVCFGGCWGCGGALGLTCFSKRRQEKKFFNELPGTNYLADATRKLIKIDSDIKKAR